MKAPRIVDRDGREWVSVNIALSPSFARACLDAWRRTDPTERHHLLRFAKAVTVPVEVLAPARALLEERRGNLGEAVE